MRLRKLLLISLRLVPSWTFSPHTAINIAQCLVRFFAFNAQVGVNAQEKRQEVWHRSNLHGMTNRPFFSYLSRLTYINFGDYSLSSEKQTHFFQHVRFSLALVNGQRGCEFWSSLVPLKIYSSFSIEENRNVLKAHGSAHA